MLARKQRRRHHDRHLDARPSRRRRRRAAPLRSCRSRHRRRSAGPSAGRPTRSSSTASMARLLVFGLLIGEARRELAVEALRRRQRPARRASGARRRCGSAAPAMSSRRFLSLALRACQAPPPSLSSVRLGRVRAVARQQLDVLDRQEQPVVAGIVDFQAVMRRAGRLDRLQPDEAADAVIGMDDDVARRQRRRLGDEVGGALALLGARAPAGRRECPARRRRRSVSVSKPASSGSTASARLPRRQASRPRPASPRGLTLPSPCSARICASRSSEPSVQPAMTHLALGRRAPPRYASTAASKTLAFGSARSSAKLRPLRDPACSTLRAAGIGRVEGRELDRRRGPAVPPRCRPATDRAGPAAPACRAPRPSARRRPAACAPRNSRGSACGARRSPRAPDGRRRPARRADSRTACRAARRRSGSQCSMPAKRRPSLIAA